MSTQFLGLRTVGYFVPNLEAAKAWYTKVLAIEPYFDAPFYVGFNVGGYELGLMPEEGENPSAKAENVLVYWGVKNVQESYERLLELGATAHNAPADVGGNIIVATVKDPWGNAFGIIDNPHFQL